VVKLVGRFSRRDRSFGRSYRGYENRSAVKKEALKTALTKERKGNRCDEENRSLLSREVGGGKCEK
jgi:hypothetical protein